MLSIALRKHLARSCSMLLIAAMAPAQQQTAEITTPLAGLGDRDPAVRRASVAALARIGAEAVPPLTRALGDRNEIVRENAAETLGNIGQAAAPAVGALLNSLSDPDPFVIGKSAEALSRIGPAAVPGLISILNDRNPSPRWPATIALGKIGPDAYPAVPALIQAMTDSSEEVRWGAAVALGSIGPRARPALPVLMLGLSDRDQDVRWGASRALDQIDPSAIEAHSDWRFIAALIDTLVPRLMNETHVPGAAIALINNRTLVWSGQYGAANRKSGTAVDSRTAFEACSMTKPVFAYLALLLVQQGKLDLDRPLVEYLAKSSLRTQPGQSLITARMVLSHTSGLPNWRKGDEERDGPIPVIFPPGSRFGYSGEGFYYLQQVVERITGESLDLYARRNLLDPLGMAHTSFAWTEELDPHIAGGHDAAGAYLQTSRYTHPNAAYTLYASADDYARFLVAILNPDPGAHHQLTQRSISMMLAPQVAVTSREPIERPGKSRGSAVSWGLGWSVNTTADGDIVHHSGANRTGFRCFTQFNPGKGSGIVIMTNGIGGSDLWTRLISRIGNL